MVENTTRTLGSTLVSGIQYDPEHGLGWDGDRMGNWKTWAGAGVTAAAGSIAGGIKMSGLSSSLVNGLGSSVSQGITTGDWKGSFRTGMTGAVSGYIGGLIGGGISDSLGVTNNAYTTTLINNYTTFITGKFLGSDEKFDMNKIGEVDTINLVVQDMYQNYNRSKAVDKILEINPDITREEAEAVYEYDQKVKADAAEKQAKKDPFSDLDTALSGIFTSLGRGLGQTMADIGGAIKDGAIEAWGGIKTGVAAAWDGVTDFTEKTVNWASGDGFVDDAARNENLMAEYRELYNNPILIAQNGSGDRMSDTGDDNRAMRDAIRMTEEREHRMQEIEGKLDISEQDLSLQMESENAKVVPDSESISRDIAATWKDSTAKEVNAKLNELRKIDPEAAKKWDAYFKGIRDKETNVKNNNVVQSNTGYLSYELDYNTAGPNWGGDFSFSSLFSSGDESSEINYSFDGLNQRENGPLSLMFQNIFGYEPNYANHLADRACMGNTEYIALTNDGVDLGTEAEYYKKRIENNEINPDDGWVNEYFKDTASKYGREVVDWDGENNYDTIETQDFENGRARYITNKGRLHAITIKKGSDGQIRIDNDTMTPENNGKLYKKVVSPEKHKWFQFIKRNSGR